MIRALRIAAIGLGVGLLLMLGIGMGFFIRANSAWVMLRYPVPKLDPINPIGYTKWELSASFLAFGWLLFVFLLLLMGGWLALYVWRRRQYEALISRLEKELADLRNLPVRSPAPLEDLPEEADETAARRAAEVDTLARKESGLRELGAPALPEPDSEAGEAS